MSKLNALRKQITALEAEFARATKAEMDASVGKVKALMASLGVTLEHLGAQFSSARARTPAAKNVSAKRAAPKRAGAGIPKYMDPKTGKTWTGFGRAPAWIEGAKDRDTFLVDRSAAEPAADVKAPAKKAKARKGNGKAPAKKLAIRAAKKAAPAKRAVAKKASSKVSATKKPAAKKPAARKVAKKRAPAAAAAAASASSTELPGAAAA